jgi:3-deoxy-D-manno-octulosonic-acid transferase
MRILYRIVSAIIYFIFWPFGRIRAASGNELWRGRLGLIPAQTKTDIWIHAASVGETKIAGYLIDYLVHKAPLLRIYLTTMTVSGHKVAEKLKSENVSIGYFPLDSKGPAGRTVARINPRLLVITETEIWPNVIESAGDKDIPIILVNGRMSDKAFRRYKLASQMLASLVSRYDRIFVKTAADETKFKYFGLSAKTVSVAGDMKFDAPIMTGSSEQINETRRGLGVGKDDFVLVAGSTRPGEEELLLKLFANLIGEMPNFRLVIAPRHLNRLDNVRSLFALQNLSYGMYGADNGSSPVTLVDVMGKLNELYRAADLAFVGGTFVNVGGHNILEPVWAGTPVVFGPHIGNIVESKDYVVKNNYGAMVDSIEEMTKLVKEFISNRNIFRVKTDEDLSHSPTAAVGDYILEKLKNV